MRFRYCLLVAAIACLAVFSVLAQSVPQLINYQGRLTDSSGQPIDGSRQIRFSVLDADTAGASVLWGETQTVTVTAGIYNVLLGSVSPVTASVFGGPDRYLEVEVAGEVLSPRQRIASVPYALAYDPGFIYSNNDFDNDGHLSPLYGGDDCNDADPSIYYGAPEVPHDGIDQSCDGSPFGPYDACAYLVGCGMFNGIDSCVEEVKPDFEINSTPYMNFIGCMEGATCGDFNGCWSTLDFELKDELCGFLDSCGYKNYIDCTLDVDQNWDGWLKLMMIPSTCLVDGGTCGTAAIEECLAVEVTQYDRNTAIPSTAVGYGIRPGADILFSNTTDSYSVRSPRGVVYSLSSRGGWEFNNTYNYDSLDELARTWPSGEYTLLKEGATLETFTMPAYDDSNFPKGFIGVYPSSGSSVDQNPLTIQWNLATPGPVVPEELGVSICDFNYTTCMDNHDLPWDATSEQVTIPSGTQTGDTLHAFLESTTPEENYGTPLKKWSVRAFKSRDHPLYIWTGPPQ